MSVAIVVEPLGLGVMPPAAPVSGRGGGSVEGDRPRAKFSNREIEVSDISLSPSKTRWQDRALSPLAKTSS
jgi:hypothetical protein